MDDALVEVALDSATARTTEGRFPASSMTTGCDPLPTTPARPCTCGAPRQDRHHIIEAGFKALGLALHDALAIRVRPEYQGRGDHRGSGGTRPGASSPSTGRRSV